MNIGSEVKVLYKQTWHKGKIISVRKTPAGLIYTVGFGEHSSYHEREFIREEVKTYQSQSLETFETEAKINMESGFELAQMAAKELLSDEKISYIDREIVGYHGAVTINAVQYDAPRIGGEIERTGYEVIFYTRIPSTYHEPENVSESSVGIYPNIGQAVQEFIKTIFKLKTQDYWESLYAAAEFSI